MATVSAGEVGARTAAQWIFEARRCRDPLQAKLYAWYAAAAAHDALNAGAENPFCRETERDLREQWDWFFGLRCKAARKEAEVVAKAEPRPAFGRPSPRRTRSQPAPAQIRTTSAAYAEQCGAELVEERV